jgi:hypothetical protein
MTTVQGGPCADAANCSLGLRTGDWVEVRSAREILATLDDRGRLEELPFMPEMLQFCGRRFRVYRSAHKTCDTIKTSKCRDMRNAVHLEGLRCDGESHSGCQAGCLLFWKHAWLRRADGPDPTRAASGTPTPPDAESDLRMGILLRETRAASGEGSAAEERYSCQATELLNATAPLRGWDVRHYLKDLTSRNVGPGPFIGSILLALYNLVMHLHWRGRPYPFIRSLSGLKTPTENLNLQPGELVEIKSKEEIGRTLNMHHRNRGLLFDVEMVPHCGKRFRVLRRVEKIINEKTGKMISLPGTCIVLDGVVCSGRHSKNRLFCPRSIYPYWREIWLKRVD